MVITATKQKKAKKSNLISNFSSGKDLEKESLNLLGSTFNIQLPTAPFGATFVSELGAAAYRGRQRWELTA